MRSILLLGALALSLLADPSATRLYKAMEGEGNRLLSPYSLNRALHLLYLGAGGESRTLLEPFAQAAPLAIPELKEGSSLWLGKGELLSSYKEAVVRAGARSFAADFADNPECARKMINLWVEDHTEGMIPGFLKENPERHTRLMLVNAVAFEGKWETPFDPAKTAKANFYGAEKTAKVPMMHATGTYNYRRFGLFSMIKLPYENDLSMYLLLPHEGESVSVPEKVLTGERPERFFRALEPRRVDLYVPRFSLEAEAPLTDMLKKAGFASLFDDRADFSAMDGTKTLKVSKTIHKVKIDVDESGTRAAAATGIAMAPKSFRPNLPRFRADRPFLFAIRHDPSQTLLFMGRIAQIGMEEEGR